MVDSNLPRIQKPIICPVIFSDIRIKPPKYPRLKILVEKKNLQKTKLKKSNAALFDWLYKDLVSNRSMPIAELNFVDRTKNK